VIVVKPGERVPLDGVIESGQSHLDTSALTGESMPSFRKPGDEVSAGMVSGSGLLTIRVIRAEEESSLSRIMKLVETAAGKKARIERRMLRFARVYTPIVVFISLIVAVLPPLVLPGAEFSTWIYRALILLVVSCPCALVISIPLAYFSGLGRASRRGVLVKGAEYLDALAETTTIIFDKTGTLTEGVFRVNRIVAYNGFSEGQLLKIAAEAEAHSTHPIAHSIRRAYGADVDTSTLEDYQEIGGHGVKVKIRNETVLAGSDRILHMENISHDTCYVEGTVIHVAVDSTYAGYIVISDEIKEGASDALEELKKMRVDELVMLTGDSRYATEAVVRALKLDTFHSDLLPEDKLRVLEDIASERNRGRMAFVGDGINDAPALAAADIGVAMGSGATDAAIETADVVLMTDSPAKIPEAIRIGRATRRIVAQNILLALGIKALFIALGIGGFAHMWQALFADVGVTILAVMNTVRNLR
jgi:Cd2+/Zn2+-exporting ATPase